MIDRLENYDRRLDGNGWDAGDFPALARQTIERTFGCFRDDSMAAQALSHRSTEPDAIDQGVHWGQQGMEIGHVLGEVAEAVHLGTAAAITGATLGVLGLAATFAIHEHATEDHAIFLRDVRTLVENGDAP